MLLVTAVPVAAQRYGLRECATSAWAVSTWCGGPGGEFRRNIDVAGGVSVRAINLVAAAPSPCASALLSPLWPDSRIVASYYPLASTTYSIATFGVGHAPSARTAQTLWVQVRRFYISARSSYRVDSCGCETLSSETDFDDWTAALQTGGGLLVTLRVATSIALDLGARYLHNGDAWCITPGTSCQPNGDVFIYPAHSQADLVMIAGCRSVGNLIPCPPLRKRGEGECYLRSGSSRRVPAFQRQRFSPVKCTPPIHVSIPLVAIASRFPSNTSWPAGVNRNRS
jgi:hypothetical protein